MRPERPPYTLHAAMELILKKCEDQTAEQVYLASEIKETATILAKRWTASEA